MKKENGFTLVELMAVLVILGVLLIMAMPSITKTFRNSKESEEAEFLDTLCAGAQAYMQFEKDSNDEKYKYPKTLEVSELQSSGYIRNNIKVPDSYENMDCSVTINANKKCTLSCK